MDLAAMERAAADGAASGTPPGGEAGVTVLDSAGIHPTLRIVRGPGEAKVLSWPGNGARHRSLHLLRLEGGAGTIPLRHPSESVYYVIDGAGTVCDPDTGERFVLTGGSIVHVGPGDAYRFDAEAGGLRVLGGACPPDPGLYALLDLPGETA